MQRLHFHQKKLPMNSTNLHFGYQYPLISTDQTTPASTTMVPSVLTAYSVPLQSLLASMLWQVTARLVYYYGMRCSYAPRVTTTFFFVFEVTFPWQRFRQPPGYRRWVFSTVLRTPTSCTRSLYPVQIASPEPSHFWNVTVAQCENPPPNCEFIIVISRLEWFYWIIILDAVVHYMCHE